MTNNGFWAPVSHIMICQQHFFYLFPEPYREIRQICIFPQNLINLLPL